MVWLMHFTDFQWIVVLGGCFFLLVLYRISGTLAAISGSLADLDFEISQLLMEYESRGPRRDDSAV